MNDPVYVPTLVLSLLFILAHLVYCRRCRQKVHMLAVVNAVLYASGIIAGFLLIGSTLFESLREQLADYKVYILIGGIATIYASLLGAWTALFTRPTRNTGE